MRVVDLSLPLIHFYHVALETCEFRSEDLKKGHSHIQWLGNISEGLSSLLSWAYTSERLNERRLWFVLLLGLHCIYLFCTIWTFTFSVLWQRSINKVPYNLTVLIESLILELPDRQCDVNLYLCPVHAMVYLNYKLIVRASSSIKGAEIARGQVQPWGRQLCT